MNNFPIFNIERGMEKQSLTADTTVITIKINLHNLLAKNKN
jgi:hypothetical protein